MGIIILCNTDDHFVRPHFAIFVMAKKKVLFTFCDHAFKSSYIRSWNNGNLQMLMGIPRWIDHQIWTTVIHIYAYLRSSYQKKYTRCEIERKLLQHNKANVLCYIVVLRRPLTETMVETYMLATKLQSQVYNNVCMMNLKCYN